MDNRQQIHLENLSLRYRGIETSALKHISVDAEFGHVIGIIGNIFGKKINAFYLKK